MLAFELETLRSLLAGASPFSTPSVGHSSDTGEDSSIQYESEFESPLPEYDPNVLSSRKDFLQHLGMPYDEFFCHLLTEANGTLPQQEFLEATNLSSSTISRFLQKMEADRQIERVQVGREKLVCLPGNVPFDEHPLPDERPDSPRV